MSSSKITAAFTNTITQLDGLIRKLEVNVGVEHSISPFAVVATIATPVVAKPTAVEPVVVAEEKPVEAKPAKKVAEKKPAEEKSVAATTTTAGEKKPAAEKKPVVAAGEKKPAAEKKPTVAAAEKPAGSEEKAEQKTATEDDFKMVDIRVGRIIDCWRHPESENLYCEKIDIGTEVRQIASGLQKFQPIENMSGLVLVMTNLKSRKLAGFESNGMVVCASNGDHSSVELLRPHADAKVGERVHLEGQEDKYSQDAQPVLNPKKKILETVLPSLHTDGECNATFAGKKWMTSTGPIKAQTLVNSTIA